MSAKEFIESGILEAYALGVCSENERAEVENWLSKSSEVRTELELIERGVEDWAFEHASAVPAQAKENILAKIQSTSASEPAKVIPLHSNKKNSINWLAAASITLLIGSVATNFVLFNNYSNVKSELAALSNQNSVLAQDFDKLQTNYSAAQGEISFISNPNIQVIQMLSASGEGAEKATIFWNRENKEVLLAVNALPELPENKQYQLWAIVEGQPVDAGVFEMTNENSKLQKMHSFENAQAFAVTIENKGGSKVPSLETLTVIGNV